MIDQDTLTILAIQAGISTTAIVGLNNKLAKFAELVAAHTMTQTGNTNSETCDFDESIIDKTATNGEAV